MHFSPDISKCLIPVGWLALFALGVTGCNSNNTQKTYPVKGKVVLKQGDIRGLAEGHVEFRSIDGPKVIAMGEIKPDGSFEMGSQVAGQDYAGVPEGTYQARILLPAGVDGQPRSPSPSLAPRYLSFDTSGLKYT